MFFGNPRQTNHVHLVPARVCEKNLEKAICEAVWASRDMCKDGLWGQVGGVLFFEYAMVSTETYGYHNHKDDNFEKSKNVAQPDAGPS